MQSNTRFSDDAWFKTCGLPSMSMIQEAENIPELEKVRADVEPMTEEYLYRNEIDQKSYHVVRGCIPSSIPINKCGMRELNLQITVAQ